MTQYNSPCADAVVDAPEFVLNVYPDGDGGDEGWAWSWSLFDADESNLANDLPWLPGEMGDWETPRDVVKYVLEMLCDDFDIEASDVEIHIHRGDFTPVQVIE